MSITPFTYGEIFGRYLTPVGDDPDNLTLVPVDEGSVITIIPKPSAVLILPEDPEADTATVLQAPITCVTDAEGCLYRPETGQRFARVLATDDPNTNPSGDWTYEIQFDFKVNGQNLYHPQLHISVPAGSRKDLTQETPVYPSPGVAIVRGLPGAKGDKGDKGDDGNDPYEADVAAGRFVGTREEWRASLQGKDGDPGPANQLAVGTVATGPVAVTITGEAPAQVIDFTIPQGETGPANTLSIGTVTKARDAAVTIRGTAPAQILDFTVPEGGGRLATIPENFETNGLIRVQFVGEGAAGAQGYRCLNGYQPAAGDQVALATIDSELIIMGRTGGIPRTPPPYTVVPVDPVNPWVNADVYRHGDIRATLTTTGWVAVTGVVIAPSGTVIGTPIFQLPGTHRPKVREAYILTTINSSSRKPNGTLLVYAEENGNVTLGAAVAAGTWISLSGIIFNNDPLGITTVSGELSYGKDAYGIVHMSGLSNTSNSTWNAPHRPSTTANIEYATGGTSGFQVVYSQPANYTILTNGAYYSASRWSWASNTLIWNTVQPQYGYTQGTTTNGPLQYAVRPDGLVVLRGQLTGGLSDSIAAVLPEGIRPPYEIHFGNGTGTANRFTITPGGSILGPTTTGTASIYFTHFMYWPSH